MASLEGRVIAITGAASGIGKATVFTHTDNAYIGASCR